ncbi:MAG TPA: sodium:proton antiporter, partial [Desulfovibrio sp.]|nr:sodium:proton antiporter [Desulfovibrio sp.]
IFIAGLAFGDQSTLDAKAKLAVLAASTASGVIGFIVLRLAGDGADGGECLQEHVDPETSCPGVPGPCGDSPSS